LNLEGNLLSKNWAVCTNTWKNLNQQDVLRYALTSCTGTDNDFTWKDFQARNNNELVAMGNFINRRGFNKYYNGIVLNQTNFQKSMKQL
jgi:methionyl-tRNA synthetase